MSTVPTGRVQPLRPGDPAQLGRYELTGRLGEGGMGLVYLAKDPAGKPVAVKVIRDDLAGDTEFRRRFRGEVVRAQQVPPFCTAEVLDADPDFEPPYLVVEYVDGPSLGEVVRDRGPLSAGNLHGLAIGVAAALTAIHGAGIIHRDLKPSNVLLAPGSPKVIDFGIARPVDAGTTHTRTDQLVGTVAYMAPERFSVGSSRALTPAADVFAWGAVVAYAGTGRVPFGADTVAEMALRIMNEPADLEGLPAGLGELVGAALAKDPADRPTARELLERLTSGAATAVPAGPPLVRGSTVAAPPPPPLPPVRPRRWLVPALSAVLAAGLTAAVLLLTGTVTLPHRAAGTGSPTATRESPSAAPGTSGPASPSASPSVPASPPASPRPGGTVPAGLDLVHRDPLTAPGLWRKVDDPVNKATCDFSPAGLTVTTQSAGVYRCPGPDDLLGDTAVWVTVTLLTPDTCASIWFRFAVAGGGYALRICANTWYLVKHGSPTPSALTTINTFPVAPMAVGTPVRVGVTMVATTIRIYRDGAQINAWTSRDFIAGKVTVGLFEVDPAVAQFQARFADIDLWGQGV